MYNIELDWVFCQKLNHIFDRGALVLDRLVSYKDAIDYYISEFNQIINQQPEPEALNPEFSILSSSPQVQEPGAAPLAPGAVPPEDGHEGGTIGQTGPAHLDRSAGCTAPSSPIPPEKPKILEPEVLGPSKGELKDYYDYFLEKYQFLPRPGSKRSIFLNSILRGASMSEALEASGYKSPVTGKLIMHEYAPKIAELMDRKGLTDERLLETLEEGLNANKPIVVGHSEVIEYADHAVRHRFMETGLKLKDHLNQKVKVDVNFNLSDRIANARAALRASKEREINASE